MSSDSISDTISDSDSKSIQKPDLVAREIAFQSSEYAAALNLRRVILRFPLKLDFSEADLRPDRDDHHFAVFCCDEQLVACLTLTRLSPNILKMRQVAVSEAMQGKGVGQLLVRSAESWARDRQVREFVLSARETAVPFYLKLGYEIFGEPYFEVTLPHRKMRKTLV